MHVFVKHKTLSFAILGARNTEIGLLIRDHDTLFYRHAFGASTKSGPVLEKRMWFYRCLYQTSTFFKKEDLFVQELVDSTSTQLGIEWGDGMKSLFIVPEGCDT